MRMGMWEIIANFTAAAMWVLQACSIKTKNSS